uniref:tRNA (guanine-N(7)-)-methyltransferase non-catalytic subunit n=1 Tax=Davidia involucrata TaxID=16924 RepID=A0A5B7C2N8_DAVIN
MDETTVEEGDHSRDTEVAPALVAVHPTQRSVAVAVGSDLRVFDLQGGCSVSLVDDSGGPLHKDSIRAICYGAKGKRFVSAGDDKLVKIWNTDPWRCICTVSSEKRVSAVAISNDALFVCFADKFGVVWVVDLDGFHENQALVNKKAVPILAHYCSIITSLEFSPDGQFIVSADRDFKIRVTVFPKTPLDGAHEIQSCCLGHTEFVSCLAFVCSPDYPRGFLVSGSGDSTVRLWDITSGSLLDTCEVGAEAGLVQSNGREDECYPAVTDLCATPDGSLVAVAIQSLSGVMLLSCNLSAKTLSIAKVVSIMGEVFIPTSLGTSSSAELLWMVTGVSNLNGFDSASLARVRVVSGLSKASANSVEYEPVVLEDKEIPGGVQLLEKLQGNVSIQKEVFLAAAETVQTAMRSLLIKKQYSAEKREFRKRGRNDKKTKQ